MAALDVLWDQFRQIEWSDAAVWTSVLTSEVARGDRNTRDRLEHVHMVQQAFLHAWRAGKHFGRDMQATTLADTLLQVNMHSAYHRGQVAMRLRELGATPPMTDFIAWAWFGKPRADWTALGP